MNKRSLNLLNYLFPFIALALVFIAWAIAAYIIDEQIILPTIGSTFSKVFSLFKSISFYKAILNTLGRAMIIYIIAFALAIIFAIVSSFIKNIDKIINIYVVIMRVIPTMAIILLALVWVSSKKAPMLVAFLVIFPIMYTNFLSSINNVDKKILEMAKVYNVNKKKLILNLYMPEIAYPIFSTIRSTLSLNFKLIIAAEIMAETKVSIGLYMKLSCVYLYMDELFAWTIVSIIIGAMLEGIVVLLQKYLKVGVL